MIAALVIVFREVLEAALVVGIVLAATRGLAGAGRWVGVGIAGGLGGATFVALFAGSIADALEGYGQEVFNAGVLLLAVAMLTWHNAWMTTHGRQMAQEMREVGQAVQRGQRPLAVLALVVGLSVLREGSETVLFLYGLATGEGGLSDALTGGALGLAIGFLAGSSLYLGLLRIPSRYLFSVTSWMITLLAAGMAAQAITFLSAADLLSIGEVLWDSSTILSQESLPGRILHTLIGYMDRPTSVQAAAYVATLALIYGATLLASTLSRDTRRAPVTVRRE
ncbi:MAG: FTR1 family protein [Magnetococcales bacterium]|nr:FTR1 family protein [Magnetococcales bacterium]